MGDVNYELYEHRHLSSEERHYVVEVESPCWKGEINGGSGEGLDRLAFNVVVTLGPKSMPHILTTRAATELAGGIGLFSVSDQELTEFDGFIKKNFNELYMKNVHRLDPGGN